MLKKRIIVCLDVRDGKTTKGIKFKGNVDIGDPVEMAERYYEAGVLTKSEKIHIAAKSGDASWL